MSPDEPLALEPARGLSPLARTGAIAAAAFLAGIVGTAGLIWLRTPAPPRPAPAPVAVTQPQAAAPAPALAPATDVATLSAREALLAGRLDQLELRLHSVDSGARTAASYATQAERLMIAAAARSAIEHMVHPAGFEAQLRSRFGEAHPDAVGTIIQAVRQPVTLDDLRAGLDSIAPRLMSAPDASIWSRAWGLLGDLVVLRQSNTLSPRSADRLARARRALDAGNVQDALAEVARMPGAAAADSWTGFARRYLGAQAALHEIEAAAMEASPAPAPTPGS